MDTVQVNMADESVNTTNSQPYVQFSDFKRTGQILILGKTFQTREVVLAVSLFIAVIVIIALIPLSTGIHITKVSPTLCDSEPCVEVAGQMISKMNTSVDPCDNFYQYSCGRYPFLHPITVEESQRTVRGIMYEKNREVLRTVLESDITNDTTRSTERKLKDFFRSCLDEVHRNDKGGKVFLDKVVNKTGGWIVTGTYDEQNWDLNANFQKVHVDFWTDVLFKLNVGTDWNDNKKNVIELDLGGLGLPWQTYTRSDEQARNTIAAYKQYIRKVGELLAIDAGLSPSDSTVSGRLDNFVADVWDTEFGLANMTLHTLPTNNPHADDQKLTLNELNEQAGGEVIDWKALIMYAFEGAGVTAETKVVLLERDYIFSLAQYLKDIQRNHYLDDMKKLMNNYFTWRMLETYLPGLSPAYYKAQQEFREAWVGAKPTSGVWEQCFNWVAQHLPEGLGALYVRYGFPKDIKDGVHQMAVDIRNKFTSRVDDLTWMDDATKAFAKDKLSKSEDKLGYPEKMDDHAYIDKIHDTLDIDRQDFFGNLLSVSRFTRHELNRQLVSAENRDTWRVPTWTVVAEFYNPWNELLVPAGFMQWPVYWNKAPAFFNWGGLGEALSKQMVFGLDETGGFYAPNGSVIDWWSQETTNNFLTARQCVIDYYSSLEAGPYKTKTSVREGEKVKIRGSYYARDAVAEIGGIRNAYGVWQDYRKANPGVIPLPALNLDPDQSFFVAYAQNFCFNRRDDLSYEIVRDGFVPEDIRVNAALQQLPDFAAAFKCPTGSKMNLQETCNVF